MQLWGEEIFIQGLGGGNTRERDHLEEIGLNGRIKLK
jgi:hypothetical protein